MLRREEKGRVALLLSDHAWLWARGFEGGGPQALLLRRLLAERGRLVTALGVVPVGMPALDFGANANGSTDWFDAAL